MTEYTAENALPVAVGVALDSTCAKSKRGVVLFSRAHGVLSSGYNGPPAPFSCDGSDRCRVACGKICVHAEMRAILALDSHARKVHAKMNSLEMLHVKVDKDGYAVPSGPPSCWECSRHILEAGISYMWLLHEDGLRRYDAVEFHRLTLRHHGLPEETG